MNAKNVLARLQVVEEKLSIAQEDEEREAGAEKVTELLRQYEECMVERRKLPVEEQRRLEEQDNEEFRQWYSEWEKAYVKSHDNALIFAKTGGD